MTGDSLNSPQKSLQILVVDDNAINLRLMTAILKRLGHYADTVEDGAASLVKFKDKQYDVILMDIMMPVMDGITATREIRKMEAERQTDPGSRVKIIATTANAFEDGGKKLLEAGVDHYMHRPIEVDELQRLLNL